MRNLSKEDKAAFILSRLGSFLENLDQTKFAVEGANLVIEELTDCKKVITKLVTATSMGSILTTVPINAIDFMYAVMESKDYTALIVDVMNLKGEVVKSELKIKKLEKKKKKLPKKLEKNYDKYVKLYEKAIKKLKKMFKIKNSDKKKYKALEKFANNKKKKYKNPMDNTDSIFYMLQENEYGVNFDDVYDYEDYDDEEFTYDTSRLTIFKESDDYDDMRPSRKRRKSPLETIRNLDRRAFRPDDYDDDDESEDYDDEDDYEDYEESNFDFGSIGGLSAVKESVSDEDEPHVKNHLSNLIINADEEAEEENSIDANKINAEIADLRNTVQDISEEMLSMSSAIYRFINIREQSALNNVNLEEEEEDEYNIDTEPLTMSKYVTDRKETVAETIYKVERVQDGNITHSVNIHEEPETNVTVEVVPDSTASGDFDGDVKVVETNPVETPEKDEEKVEDYRDPLL